ncbi:MAG TPA: dUTP diphosphatase, partial [Actinomycetota bacterium]|nr:dUTP diphosphatase [Actinomycetota bacterium]
MRLEVQKLDVDALLPAYAKPGDAGLDLHAAEDVTLKPGERSVVGTRIAIAIPEGFAGFVHARSGRALREGLALVNAPGLIDSGYRGEIKVVVVNLDNSDAIEIRKGEKIAQL